MPLCRPAALRAARDVIQGPHPFVGDIARLLDRTSNPADLIDEIIQLGLDLLADLVEGCVDMDAIDALITRGAPGGLPALPPGDSR